MNADRKASLVVAVNCLDPTPWQFARNDPYVYPLLCDVPLYGLFVLGGVFWRELRGMQEGTPMTASAAEVAQR